MPFYDYYDDLQPTGIGRAWAMTQARNVLAHLRAAHPTAASLLEIGPGHGSFALACTQAGLRYTALDVNLRLLQSIQAAGHVGVRARAPRLPITDRRYDIAFASHVVEHSPSFVDALAFTTELSRVVAPAGVVALVAPDYLALREDFWNCDYSHGFVTTRRRLGQLLRDAGLQVIGDTYIWGPFQGLSGALAGATLGSRLSGAVARALPGRAGERLYKARLTFSRAILILGQVPL